MKLLIEVIFNGFVFLILGCFSPFYLLGQSELTQKHQNHFYKIVFENRQGDSNDTLYYSAQRPLVWADFTAKPRAASSYIAATFSGFGYTGKVQYEKDTVIIALVLEVYFIKSFSWAHNHAKTDYALAHEQQHFDLTYLIAERFKKRLKEIDFDADYDSIIQYQYLQSYRDLNRVQERYDNDTRHGTSTVEQSRWKGQVKRWIDEEINRKGP